MEKEDKSSVVKNEEVKRPSSLKNNKVANKKVQQKGLNMTRLGKPDLLRLLSILEGELEARDIYIVNLQAQLNQGSYKEGRYFNHSLHDPFIALMRDNEAMSGSVTPTEDKLKQKVINSNNMVKIQPLPLLEKLTEQFKKQQVKVKQHLALSDAYYHMVNEELMVEKKKNSSPEPNSFKLENDQLKLFAQVERNKSKKIETEYKKLLQLVSKERQKYRTIITLLLEERRMRELGEKGNKQDNLVVEELLDQDEKVLEKNIELQTIVEDLKTEEIKMKKEIENLKQEINFLNQKLPSLPDKQTKQNDQESIQREELNNLLEGAREVVVSVKRTPTIVEKRRVRNANKEPPKLPAKTITRNGSLKDPKKGNSRPKPLSINPQRLILSSPTSGAANFALNSPNEPPLTPFPPNLNNATTKRPSTAPVSQPSTFLATRQKFQRISNTGNVCVDNKKISQRSDKVPVLDGVFPVVTSDASRNKPLETKQPQPPKPVKQSHLIKESNQNETTVKPPPLPPKKPHLSAKNSSNKTVLNSKKDTEKKTGGNTENVGLLNVPKAPPPKANVTRSGSTKRTSLNSNNNNNRQYKSHENNMQPIPPNGKTPPRLNLTAQQRLFTQDGSSGELRSPVTHNVPKSPLAPNIFTFK